MIVSHVKRKSPFLNLFHLYFFQAVVLVREGLLLVSKTTEKVAKGEKTRQITAVSKPWRKSSKLLDLSGENLASKTRQIV